MESWENKEEKKMSEVTLREFDELLHELWEVKQERKEAFQRLIGGV